MGRDRDLVADAAHTLTACFTANEVLITKPDATGPGFISGSANDSRAPWNELSAHALMIPWHELIALEREVRLRAGLTPIERGGSYGNRVAALAALVKVARGLGREEVAYITGKLEGWAQLTFALPAVDQLPQWNEIPVPGGPPDCPHCHTPSLRLHEGYGVVACLYRRCPSHDGPGGWAQVTADGGPLCWQWGDGTVQP